MNDEFLKIEGYNLFIATWLLGLREAQLWVGRFPIGVIGNNEWRFFSSHFKAIADMLIPQRISGIETLNLIETVQYPGWFKIEMATWNPGIYRLMIHSKVGIQAPNGTKLISNKKDLQYSWPDIPVDYLLGLSDDLKDFLYLEPNGRGFCIRIEVTENHGIKAAGNGREWIYQWPEMKKKISEKFGNQ